MSTGPHDHDHDHAFAGHRRTVEAPTVHESPFPVSSDDPTATSTLRNRYAAEMTRRFEALKEAVVIGVVERDAFGIADLDPDERAGPNTPPEFKEQSADPEYAANPLGPPADPERFESFEDCVDSLQAGGMDAGEARRVCGSWEAATNRTRLEAAQDRTGGAGAGINIEPPHAGQFAFPSDERKVGEFLAWLGQQVNRGILDADPTATDRSITAQEAWQNIYLRQAYSAGVTHADAYLVDQDIIPPAQTLDDVFRATKHADAAGLIYTRAYSELDGVTSAMGQQMGRELANGLAQGHNPRRIATAINDRVEDVGIHRGRLIARTETIRAHNEAALNRYEDVGDRLDGVTTLAEHITAADGRVCPECSALSGQVYSIREARGRIPVHPNCRCTWVPIDSRDVPAGKGGTASATDRVEEFFEATSDLPPAEQVDRVSEWLVENTRYGAENDDAFSFPIDLGGFDPERAQAVSNVLMRMEHADLLGPTGQGVIRVRSADELERLGRGLEGAFAFARGPDVTFNSTLYNADRLAELRDFGYTTGRFYRGDMPILEYPIVHEFGHVFHSAALSGRAGTIAAVRDGRFSPALRDSIGGKVSQYAATSPAEFVAEMFVRLAYDMPVSPEHLNLYRRYGGPDIDTYRGFMVAEGVAANMADNVEDDEAARDRAANVEETEAGAFPEDLPPELRAEAEAVYDGMFGDDGIFAEVLPLDDEVEDDE